MRRVCLFATEFNLRGSSLSSSASIEIERMVIASFLICNRHSYSEFLLREPLPVARSSVRLAEEYIEAHWDQPLDLEALARHVNVGLRNLFAQFRKERGYGPAAFSKRTRLHKSLEFLERPTEQTTVTEVALKCGFNNVGTFAHDFRRQFGQTPSDVLSKARKQR